MKIILVKPFIYKKTFKGEFFRKSFKKNSIKLTQNLLEIFAKKMFSIKNKTLKFSKIYENNLPQKINFYKKNSLQKTLLKKFSLKKFLEKNICVQMY